MILGTDEAQEILLRSNSEDGHHLHPLYLYAVEKHLLSRAKFNAGSRGLWEQAVLLPEDTARIWLGARSH